MFSEKSLAADISGGGITKASRVSDDACATGSYIVTCLRADGSVRWSEEITNLVTLQGRNDNLEKYLSGFAYTANWYIGIISAAGFTAGPVAGDTAASHAGWSEEISYSEGARPTASFAASSGGAKSLATPAVYTVTADVTIRGMFLVSSGVKGGGAGVLYSAGLFSGGNKVMQATDILNVSYTATLSAPA